MDLQTAPLAPPAFAQRQSFHALGPGFHTELNPSPVPEPHWLARSDDVADLLGFDAAWMAGDEALQVFAGNALLPGSRPLASVYSGHQFGVWAGQLGDGRAILLGETDNGLEVQLKGAGRTPYSRMGDGRAVLRSSIREFLCSEAMHALGIPSTRALALVGSPLPVRREQIETAAVVTRVAPSFIRFGHFEHFAARDMQSELKALADQVIDQHYPECRSASSLQANAYANFLQAVSERTARLLAQWQAQGFCHGVMNTDNMSILGLTIDYGPFQFLDSFDPGHVCNHSDSQGRYAFNRQPQVAYWNLFCLGQALLPLIGDEELTLAALESYKQVFPQAYAAQMLAKLGLPEDAPGTSVDEGRFAHLVNPLLQLLSDNRVDYSIFFTRLTQAVQDLARNQAQNPQVPQQADFEPLRDIILDRAGFDAWALLYSEQLALFTPASAASLMQKSNPRFLLRNHLAETVIRATQEGDFGPLTQLQAVLQTPFDAHPEHADWADFPPDWASSLEISCSS
ncbi:protein adenylyltransferase SelO [Comamonas composti]|uniref:protein adenylyltransferase SelO n=1 Tax=Comamonas composti TaxID=408558 RepID=UPI000415D4D9|nr:YdiU family protein [Comamonas composti]